MNISGALKRFDRLDEHGFSVLAPARQKFSQRGQGLLAVIDHGDGMMAVYGNNQRLLVQVGDTVDVGDPIAYIGADATERQAQLYFELRLEGQAVNPLSWLTPTPG